jgi:hypothetical protein
LARAHADGLRAAINDGQLDALWFTIVPSADAVEAWIETALAAQTAGRALPFVVRRLRDDRIVGPTATRPTNHALDVRVVGPIAVLPTARARDVRVVGPISATNHPHPVRRPP